MGDWVSLTGRRGKDLRDGLFFTGDIKTHASFSASEGRKVFEISQLKVGWPKVLVPLPPLFSSNLVASVKAKYKERGSDAAEEGHSLHIKLDGESGQLHVRIDSDSDSDSDSDQPP